MLNLYQHPDPIAQQARRYVLGFVQLAHPDWLLATQLGANFDIERLPQRYHQDFISHVLHVHRIDVSLLNTDSLAALPPDQQALAAQLLSLLNVPRTTFDRIVQRLSLCAMGKWFGRELFKSRIAAIELTLATAFDLLPAEVPSFLAAHKPLFAALPQTLLQASSAQTFDYLPQFEAWLPLWGRMFLLDLSSFDARIAALMRTKFPITCASTHSVATGLDDLPTAWRDWLQSEPLTQHWPRVLPLLMP